MNSIRATHQQIAFSAGKRETAFNTEQTLDTLMSFEMGNIANLQARREDDSGETIGQEEASRLYDDGATVAFPVAAAKAQAQHFGMMLAYALGQIATAAQGDGFMHTITPIDDDLDGNRSNPSFTAAMRYGKTIAKRRFAGCVVDSFTAKFARGSWITLDAQIMGSGKYTGDTTMETLEAAGNAESLTLAANGVAGSTAAERLNNVQAIMVELASGIWTPVAFSAVSAATPAIITITSPGGSADPVDYQILYRPVEAAWGTFPARLVEDPLRISELTLNVGGTWTGSAFSGGRTLTAELLSMEWQFNNNGEMMFVPGAGGAYAGRYARDNRTQKIALSREFRDMRMQHHITDNTTFGIYLKAEGALYDETYRRAVELVWPKCAVLAAPIGTEGNRISEAVDIQVLQDATYASVIAKVANLAETYASAT